MGFIEKIRNYALSKGYLNSARDGYDDEFYDEDGTHEDEEEEEKTVASVVEKPVSFAESRRFSKPYAATAYRSGSFPSVTPAKVYSIHTGGSTQQTVVITHPESIDDSGYICDYIKGNDTVVVNLEGIKQEAAQRIVDFLSGVVHSLEGDIQYLSNKIFILAPKNVEITGKIKEELRSGGILATMKTSFR